MKTIIIIEPDNAFINSFKGNLKSSDLLSDFKIVIIDPSVDSFESESEISETIDRYDETLKAHQTSLALVLVDIEIFHDIHDKYGIEIAKRIKFKYPQLPVLNITYHTDEDSLTKRFVDAMLSINDGVLPKKFFTTAFSKLRFREMFSRLNDKITFSSQVVTTEQVCNTSFKYGIIAAMYSDEFEHIEKCFKQFEKETIVYGSSVFYRWSVTVKGKVKSIIASFQATTGMIDASILAAEMILRFRPEFLIMTGVCGGKDDEKINFGDIVIASKVFTFQKGKLSDSGTGSSNDPDIFQQELEDITLSDRLNRYQPYFKDIKKKIIESYSEQKDEIGEPSHLSLNVHYEPMACSSFVINKEGFFEERIKLIDRKTVAVEMESYGVARACKILNDGETIPIIIKSVMDKTKKKNDSAKSFAAYTSAQFIKHLIIDGVLD